MAARGGEYNGWAEPATTPLQRYIRDPQNFEPNLALNLEIVDVINAKKAGAPREAAIAIINYVNSRNPNVSLLALNLLDHCVKNCGYAFHLQISTKEFLNELVRRFPERPPIRYSRVQNKILELIEEWRTTICVTSKFKDDLGFIRDMHRLLHYKGYVFPEVKKEDAAVLNPTDALRSAEEMEEEERAAQSAKLQELIRRGTPQDLQEANKLMKVMAGYDTRNKTNYRAKAAEEVAKVQQKARILEEMLQNYKEGDESINEATFEELAGAMASAQPKIQKMCEEESDDTEAVAKLFEINDSIHRTLQRYKLMKKGDMAGAAQIPKGTLGTSGAGVRKGPDNELSLIDFGTEDALGAEPAAEQGSQKAPASLEDDLLGLSVNDNNSGQISLGGAGNFFSMPPPTQQTSSPQPTGKAVSNGPPKPNYDIFHNLDFAQQAPTQSYQPAQAAQQRAPAAKPANDPFAALSSLTPRQGSPFAPHQQSSFAPPPGRASLDKAPLAQLAQTSRPSSRGGSVAPQNDDDWNFSSSVLPDQSSHDITLVNSAVNILFHVSKTREADGAIKIKASVSNNTASPVADFTLQIAVMKAYTLRLEPQTSRNLAPNQRAGITQVIHVVGVEQGRGTALKIRWKVSYSAGGTPRQEQGELAGVGVQ